MFVAGGRDRALVWADVAWLKAHTHLPVLLKGVVTYADAMLAVAAGADGVWVRTRHMTAAYMCEGGCPCARRAAMVRRLGARARYGDAKVANRDAKVWHGATENGP